MKVRKNLRKSSKLKSNNVDTRYRSKMSLGRKSSSISSGELSNKGAYDKLLQAKRRLYYWYGTNEK